MGLESGENTFGLYCTAQVVFSRDQARRCGEKRSGTGQEADVGFRFYERMLAKEHQGSYRAVLFSRLRSDLAGRLRYSEADEFSIVLICFSEKTRDVCVRGRRVHLSHELVSHPHSLTHRQPCSIPRLRSHDVVLPVPYAFGHRQKHRYS